MNPELNPFLRVLDPKDNQTGGGAASAIAGAMAASLVAMVARLSVGRKGMKPETFYTALDSQAQAVADHLLQGARQDSEAFDKVMATYRLPKDTAEEKASRAAAIQDALIRATHVPLQNAEACRKVLELAVSLRGRSNPNASSDLECAGYLAQAGLRGCLSNIRVNLEAIKDPQTVNELEAHLKGLEKYLAESAIQEK